MLSLSTPIPCIRGQYGSKLYVFQTTVQPKEIKNLLGHDPRSKNWSSLEQDIKNLYDGLQRKTDKKRSNSTAEYIQHRIASDNPKDMIGAFPAISIGMVNVPVFRSYSEFGNSQINDAIGYLEFDLSASNVRVLLDGLARVTGALNLMDEGYRDVVNCFTFPVTIYAPTEKTGKLTVYQLGQIFHDFNFLATPVSKSLAISMDQTDLYVSLTREIAESPVIMSRGGIQERGTKLTKKSTAFVVQQNLLKFIRGACEGFDFQKSTRKTKQGQAYLTSESFDSIKSSIEYFLERLATLMEEKFNNREYVHRTSPGWCALGLIFHDWGVLLGEKLSEAERDEILEAIANIDWSRYNPSWDGMLGSMEPDDTGSKKLTLKNRGNAAVRELTQYIRDKTGLTEKLKAYTDSQMELEYG